MKWTHCMCTYTPSSRASLLPPSHPSRSSQSTKLSPLVYSSFPLAICFTPRSVYMSVLLSKFFPPSRSHAVSTCLLSTLVSLFQKSMDRWMDREDVVHVYNEVLLSHKKEQNWVICRDVDGSRLCHTEWSQSEREKQILCINTYMWNLEKWYKWTY